MRKFTYVILAVNVLFLLWLIAGIAGAGSSIKDCADLTKQALAVCEDGNAGTAIGTGIGVLLIVGLWGFVDVILGVLWLVTNGRAKSKRGE